MIVNDPLAGRIVVYTSRNLSHFRQSSTPKPFTLTLYQDSGPGIYLTMIWTLKSGLTVVYTYHCTDDYVYTTALQDACNHFYGRAGTPQLQPTGGYTFNSVVRPARVG